MTVSVENLSLFSNQDTLVKGLSFYVSKGKAVGIVGPSGCGKSTLLRAIASLHNRWEGSIKVGGSLQMVFQDPLASLHPKHSVEKILSEPLRIVGKKVDQKLLIEALERVSLSPELLSRYPHQLSGGQRQRLSIARSLVVKPEILLLDECTASLDKETEKSIMQLLKRLQKEMGLTYIVVSHDIPLIEDFCDEVVRISE